MTPTFQHLIPPYSCTRANSHLAFAGTSNDHALLAMEG